jgi:transcriptional regulator with XRE-family HTH domain
MEGPDTAGGLVQLIAFALRRERAQAGLTLTELARQAGIAKSTLSQLESGTGNPSVETLWALAVALGVPFSRLVDPPGTRVEVIRAGEGSIVYSQESDYRVSLLSSGPAGTRRDIYRLSAEPGAPRLAEPHQAGTVEHLVLSSGRVLAGLTSDPVELGPGDYIRYPGDLPHTFNALEPGTFGVLVSEYA